ncbi:DUF2239 family protein [Marilutibacter maris]|uniref:DUF2239 family protein n=1 Tax=Marilutibacter maris TaxID=1605891 RepID=A0A2U9TC28_9GAMM|nr:DUF2239 family protein [Lysobacter maris]AWV08108.1 hypothetical protein C9I47_2430 [Lysobacter maris]KAB8172251.1 DUF2239 family protein [Lysobacter maris]
MNASPSRYTAFAGQTLLAHGPLDEVACAAAAHGDDGHDPVLVFADDSGRVVDLDLRGSADEIRQRLAATPASASPPAAPGNRREALRRIGIPPRGRADETADTPRPRGRPKLGVVAREVTLLPRHWEWLAEQPGGASAALRRLVESARHANADRDGRRRSQEAAYRFMTTLAGDLPGYEEANRALFAGDGAGFARHTGNWPRDLRDYALRLAADALANGDA